jgi:hypothetical protein
MTDCHDPAIIKVCKVGAEVRRGREMNWHDLCFMKFSQLDPVPDIGINSKIIAKLNMKAQFPRLGLDDSSLAGSFLGALKIASNYHHHPPDPGLRAIETKSQSVRDERLETFGNTITIHGGR